MIVQPEKFINEVKNRFYIRMFIMKQLPFTQSCARDKKPWQETRADSIHTPRFFLEDIISDLDMVLFIPVNPGYGGQKYHEYLKVSHSKELIQRNHRSY